MEELNKIWLITGICGQDGSIMADYLFSLGYINIHGTMRRSATFNTSNIDHIFSKLTLHYIDLTDTMNVFNVIQKVKPDYILNFAAMSHVKISEELSNYTFQVNTMGILSILQSVRNLGLSTKVYQASTSEIYGNSTDGTIPLTETSKMHPVSIYGISKMAAQQICDMYRDAYGMFVVNSLLFNHESSRRGRTFVTQKIVDYVAKYNNDVNIEPLQLGNLNARRDWGCAHEYMKAVYLMMTSDKPKNYVISSGETHSVREFVELSFARINVKIKWDNEGINEIGYNTNDNQIVIKVNSRYYRDIDIECLLGDSSKAHTELDWEYTKTFPTLVNDMVDNALVRIN